MIDMDKLEVARARAEATARIDLEALDKQLDALADDDHERRHRLRSLQGAAQHQVNVTRHATDWMAEVRKRPGQYDTIMAEVTR